MGIIHIMERGGDQLHQYKKALKKAKEAIDEICELSEEMEEQYSDRGYGERYPYMRGGYSRRDEWDGVEERRGRDSMGRYR